MAKAGKPAGKKEAQASGYGERQMTHSEDELTTFASTGNTEDSRNSANPDSTA